MKVRYERVPNENPSLRSQAREHETVMRAPSLAQVNDLLPTGETVLPASGHSDNPPTVQPGEGARIVAELISQKRVPEIFGLLEIVTDLATQEKLLADLPLLPWYPPDHTEGGLWREE